jgi:hypothetical protein
VAGDGPALDVVNPVAAAAREHRDELAHTMTLEIGSH